MSEVPHGPLHVGHQILQKLDGPAGAVVGAVMVPVVLSLTLPLSGPVILIAGAAGACAGWAGFWKKMANKHK